MWWFSSFSTEDPDRGPHSDALRKGHDRNGVDAYRGAKWSDVPRPSLEAGITCPDGAKGKVDEVKSPGVMVLIVRQAPLHTRVYQPQKLHCNLCGKVFTAQSPVEAGSQKYDATAARMTALLTSRSGLPFNLLAGLQRNLETPLPASTQEDVMATFVSSAVPSYAGINHPAAQGEVPNKNDTTAKVLEFSARVPKSKFPKITTRRTKPGCLLREWSRRTKAVSWPCSSGAGNTQKKTLRMGCGIARTSYGNPFNGVVRCRGT